eukprot:TRINITY_DN2039_c1_g1_i3.p2 TRINITY_DN2039_c1_g1~~TRINITY_DN2039_c1_g1_i3.p2  ORF type:complete len:132 (+),score=36.52 TRINITY_DN2039_c1_g1_i3:244-639(+)
MGHDIVHEFDDAHTVVHYRYKFPFPCDNRDFEVFEINKQISDDQYVAIATSIVGGYAPTSSKFVRGDLMVSGYIVTSTGKDTCELQTLMQCDPRGMLPTALVNMDAPDAPLVLFKIKNYVETGAKYYNKKK